MNNNYYQNPMFPTDEVKSIQDPYEKKETYEKQTRISPTNMHQYMPAHGQTRENILKTNKGKLASFHLSFPDSVDWRDTKITGIIEEAGVDHIIISDPKNGKWYLIEPSSIDYIEFEEVIQYPFVKYTR